MNKYDIVSLIEDRAPLDSQEKWDCSGWAVDNDIVDVDKVMVALTVTEDIYQQAKSCGCGLIISHHPLFCVPYQWRDINIYASHTPMDKMLGGTTDTLIKLLGFDDEVEVVEEFVRVIKTNVSIEELREKVSRISSKYREVNNQGQTEVSSIGFCAGSGADFLDVVDVDVFITGDLKYHTAVEADKVIFDVGHFESEVGIKDVFRSILADTGLEVVIADEKSPFI